MNLVNNGSPQCKTSDNIFSFYCGLVIKKIRKEKGITGFDLAQKINISQQQMSRYERGINKISVDMLIDIAFVLDVSFDKFMRTVFFEIKKSDDKNTKLLKGKVSNLDSFYFY